MEKGRGASRGNGGERADLPSGFPQKRACLLLSLIVLVWNVAATARHFLSAGCPRIAETGQFEPAPADPGARFSQDNAAVIAFPRPLTVKQNYLLGKKVDINRASLAEIEGLPGISRKVAESVIETRSRLGGFRSAGDLLQVKGIKEKRLKKILPFLVDLPNN